MGHRKGPIMKQTDSSENIVTLEQVSVTIARRNQDVSGKQTDKRTFYSIRTKIRQPIEEGTNLSLKNASNPNKRTRHLKQRKEITSKTQTQLSLFPD